MSGIPNTPKPKHHATPAKGSGAAQPAKPKDAPVPVGASTVVPALPGLPDVNLPKPGEGAAPSSGGAPSLPAGPAMPSDTYVPAAGKPAKP